MGHETIKIPPFAVYNRNYIPFIYSVKFQVFMHVLAYKLKYITGVY